MIMIPWSPWIGMLIFNGETRNFYKGELLFLMTVNVNEVERLYFFLLFFWENYVILYDITEHFADDRQRKWNQERPSTTSNLRKLIENMIK